MCSAYSIPNNNIRENISSSINLLLREGGYNSWLGFSGRKFYSTADGATDAIMLNNALYYENDSIIFNAIMNPRKIFKINENTNNDNILIEILAESVKNNNNASINFYPRYWHGYLIFLKPLLNFFTVAQLRIINFILQFSILILIIAKLFKCTKFKFILAFILSIIFIDPVNSAKCFQYSGVYYITLISILVMLSKNFNYLYLFLLNGILTAFIDFLTYPLATLGIPLIIYLILNPESKLITIFKFSLSWLIGYSGMWSGKWLANYFFTGYNIFSDVSNAINDRIHGTSAYFGRSVTWNLVFDHVKNLNYSWIIALICIASVIIFLTIILRAVKLKITSLNNILPLIVVSLYPVIWFAVLQNHSIIHYFFTCKILAITFFAVLVILIKCSIHEK